MPQTDVDICNLGLAIIGATTQVVTLSQPKNVNEVRCARFYPVRRDAELRKYRWNFAKCWQQMNAPDPSVTHPRFQYAYPLPTNPWCLRIIRTAQDGGSVDWTVERRHLFTNMGPGFWLPFIGRAPEADFDVLFVEVLAASMALILAEPITQSNTKKADAREAYRDAVAVAKQANAFEVEPEQDQPDSWELAAHS